MDPEKDKPLELAYSGLDSRGFYLFIVRIKKYELILLYADLKREDIQHSS